MSVQTDVTRLVDVFAASDGGVELVTFKARMESFEEKSEAGDVAAQELLLVMRRFVALVDIVLK